MLRINCSSVRLGAGVGRVLAILVLGFGAMPTLWAATLDPALLPQVQAATFEVVAAKPAHDPLTYARPLPFKLIPYQQRTDDYYSIGTAFAIGSNRYVTAGHVLLSGLNSLWGPPALRDGNGHVYTIANIEKFSLRKDFAVFSLARPPAESETLPVDSDPALNQAVYAVGNALGTGVVIRSGLYTSNTPEQQDGAWKWVRFSAAVSPGNSGGPLLDKHGKVIGVVLMKSPNENLNYALPISEVLNAPQHQAVINRRLVYQFDLIDSTRTGTFEAQFPLPKSLADFYATFLGLRHASADSQFEALLAQEADKMFPNGSGSHRALHSTASLSSLPVLLVRNHTDTWVRAVKEGPDVHLVDNGYVAKGKVGYNMLFHLRKPDSVSAAELYGSPETLAHMLLKAGLLYRNMASDHIKVTSLGKPILTKSHTDRWQRHWQVMIWPIPFANAEAIVLALPVPDGYAGIARLLPAARQHDFLINLEAMTDFFNTAYDGTLAQWKDYLEQTNLLPEALKHIDINAEYNEAFHYASPRVSFSVASAAQKITPDSDLTLGFDFFRSDGKVVWSVGDVYLSEDAYSDNWINIQRHVKPSSDLGDGFKSHWNDIADRRHPFDGVARYDDDVMKITRVVTSSDTNPSVLYTAFYARGGKHPQKMMKSRIDLLMEHLEVTESGPGSPF
ncbi:MAG TPA: serine protease [Gammaproteobacteria bacterium]|nr:serine protease [Gammaproteobacteria bacterium]